MENTFDNGEMNIRNPSMFVKGKAADDSFTFRNKELASFQFLFNRHLFD